MKKTNNVLSDTNKYILNEYRRMINMVHAQIDYLEIEYYEAPEKHKHMFLVSIRRHGVNLNEMKLKVKELENK